MFRERRSLLVIAVVAAVIGLPVWPAEARMTVLYDVNASMQLLVGTQPDGTPGLRVEDGLYQQVTLGPLPVDRLLGALTGGTGSLSTPSIRGLDPTTIAAYVREQVDAAGARMTFIDIGPDYDTAGQDGQNLGAAMEMLAATPHALGGTYADRVHMYVSRLGDIANPETRAAFWDAMARSGGVWLEAYQGREQWAPEYWLAWPRALRDGLVRRGMDPVKLHIIVRGANMAATWAHFRTGVACEALANGPGAYRIEDHAGFVREFRATFGTAPAPVVGPSQIACLPTPELSEPRATQLADALALEAVGVPLTRANLSTRFVRTGRTSTLNVALGADPAGLAGRLGIEPVAFWKLAKPRIAAARDGVLHEADLDPAGRATLTLTPQTHGPIRLTLTVDGAALRRAIGPPVDLAQSLRSHAVRIEPVLGRMISTPLSWNLQIPLHSTLRSGPPLPTLTARILRRQAPPARSRVELRLSRPASKLLVEVGFIKNKRFVPVRRLRLSGIRTIVSVRVPLRVPVSARVLPE